MITIFCHEMKRNFKTLLIWSLSVGFIGMVCILLYSSMEADMQEMAEGFSNMGAFSEAFGMTTLSIGTLAGFFATEIGTVQGLGGGLFAAGLGIGLLSKEEDGHTGEFLYTLPLSRTTVVIGKLMAMLGNLVLFNLICLLCYQIGFAILGESVDTGKFLMFMGLQLLMYVEIGAICFAISAFQNRSKIGIGMGVALLLYAFDLMGRVVPDLGDLLFVGPYSYANASDIFAGRELETTGILLGVCVVVIACAAAFVHYNRKDLQS